ATEATSPSSSSWMKGLGFSKLCFSSPCGGCATISTCWEKLWLMKVASRARLRGALIELPSSCGGSEAVSFTTNSPNSESSLLSKNNLSLTR
ncbi:unnamed protein product, partial [Ixodes persulcatus]